MLYRNSDTGVLSRYQNVLRRGPQCCECDGDPCSMLLCNGNSCFHTDQITVTVDWDNWHPGAVPGSSNYVNLQCAESHQKSVFTGSWSDTCTTVGREDWSSWDDPLVCDDGNPFVSPLRIFAASLNQYLEVIETGGSCYWVPGLAYSVRWSSPASGNFVQTFTARFRVYSTDSYFSTFAKEVTAGMQCDEALTWTWDLNAEVTASSATWYFDRNGWELTNFPNSALTFPIMLPYELEEAGGAWRVKSPVQTMSFTSVVT